MPSPASAICRARIRHAIALTDLSGAWRVGALAPTMKRGMMKIHGVHWVVVQRSGTAAHGSLPITSPHLRFPPLWALFHICRRPGQSCL